MREYVFGHKLYEKFHVVTSRTESDHETYTKLEEAIREIEEDLQANVKA